MNITKRKKENIKREATMNPLTRNIIKKRRENLKKDTRTKNIRDTSTKRDMNHIMTITQSTERKGAKKVAANTDGKKEDTIIKPNLFTATCNCYSYISSIIIIVIFESIQTKTKTDRN